MRRLAQALMLAVLSTVLLTGSMAFAGGKGNGPHGNQGMAGAESRGQWNEGMPPGFNRGQKQGWTGNTHPRGWTPGKGKKTGWGDNLYPKGIGKKQ